MPRKRTHGFDIFAIAGVDVKALSEEQRKEVQIIFRAPKYLRDILNDFVRKNQKGSMNAVLQEATWKYIQNYNYAKMITEEIERNVRWIFERVRKDFGEDYQIAQRNFKELVNELKRYTDPIIDAGKKIEISVQEALRETQEKLIPYIIYYVGKHVKLEKKKLIDLLFTVSKSPQWIIENAINQARIQGFVVMNQGILELAPLGNA